MKENRVLLAHKRDLEKKIEDIESYYRSRENEASSRQKSTWVVKYNSISKDLIRAKQEITTKDETIKKLGNQIFSLREKIKKSYSTSSIRLVVLAMFSYIERI